jgi:hypothetical protein
MKKPPAQLPDIEDDATFSARLQPLASKILPTATDKQLTGMTNFRNNGGPEVHKTGTPRQTAALRRDEIEAKRGPKKRYEYVLPVRVGDALADDARSHGLSATGRLLQVLRDAGYPVIPEDLLDLRLERGGK